ncbi:hypothetical protein FD09_GL000876 [Schleiferilactobacillus perolens DSM 12744]|uniref:Minor capsid protein n=2 Tax=Schleiferilactobacillus perolens TaxID=100468 RepID=A0A0R1MR71_9LACO|nr:hypothetical protein FD09_GL000876 [Schleiferilactobacillus perolens DSM 12744]
MGIMVHTDVDLMKKIGSEAQKKALVAAASQLAQELDDYNTGVVPRLHGDLRGTSTPDGSAVEFSSVYAAAQFNGGYTKKDGTKVTFKHYTTEGTGPQWDKMIQANGQKMKRIRDAYLRGLDL